MFQHAYDAEEAAMEWASMVSRHQLRFLGQTVLIKTSIHSSSIKVLVWRVRLAAKHRSPSRRRTLRNVSSTSPTLPMSSSQASITTNCHAQKLRRLRRSAERRMEKRTVIALLRKPEITIRVRKHTPSCHRQSQARWPHLPRVSKPQQVRIVQQ
jgi:hypothetical protein